MVIQSFSHLQDSGNYYLNSNSFDSRLLFSDTNSSLNYYVVRLDYNDNNWKIISAGKLNGYSDSATYDYKFDLDKYIKISHYRELNLERLYEYNETILYQDLIKYNCQVSLFLTIGNLITDNSSLITLQNNGEYWLNSGILPTDLTSTYSYHYIFYDKVNSTNPLPDNKVIYTGTWLPITSYSTLNINVKIVTKEGLTIMDNGLSTLTSLYPRLFYIYIPINAHIVYLNNIPYYTTLKCSVNSYNFWNINGCLDVIYTEGNIHEVNNIEKEYITINNVKIPLNIKINKQYKANSGFRLNQDQVYSLIKSPFVFQQYDGYLDEPARNLMINSTVNQIIYPVEYLNVITPSSQYLKNSTSYLFSVGNAVAIGSSHNGFFTVEIYDVNTQLVNREEYFYFNSGMQFFAFDVPATGNYIVRIHSNSADNIRVYNCKLEYETDYNFQNYLIGEKYVTRFFLLEKSYPTEWSPALEDDGSEIPNVKRLLIDTTSFEGYIGNKFSEKNIELLFSEEKVQKRKTNFNLTFWD